MNDTSSGLSTSAANDTKCAAGETEMVDPVGPMTTPARLAAGARARAMAGVTFGVTMLGTLGVGSDSVTVSFM